MDMSGNVFEWQANYRDKDHDVLALRGGSWNLDGGYARVSGRDYYSADLRLDDVGLRVVVFALPN